MIIRKLFYPEYDPIGNEMMFQSSTIVRTEYESGIYCRDIFIEGPVTCYRLDILSRKHGYIEEMSDLDAGARHFTSHLFAAKRQ